MKISAIIIAKDAENLIIDCLESVSFCDEIIVIDSGSSDRTVDIAKKFGSKVFEYRTDDFSKLRNFGLEKANGEWIFYIDSDERVSDLLRRNIQYQISNFKFPMPEVYKIRRKNFYLGNHEWPYIEKLERLFKKDSLKKWRGKLHESPVFEGNLEELEGFLLHYTHRDLSSMLAKTIEWSEIEAKLRLKANHPKMNAWRFFRVMISSFLNSYVKQKGWKAGTVGLIESLYQAFSIFVTYSKLWEMQQKLVKDKK